MTRVRTCPVCKCGSKKFRRIGGKGETVMVQCLKCSARMKI